MERIIHSRMIRWLIMTGLFYLLIFTLLRLIFHIVFRPPAEAGIWEAFWMGIRYDARTVCVFLLLPFLFVSFYIFKPYSNNISAKLLLIYTRLFGIVVIVFYTVDFCFFAYMRQRLNASLLTYAEDAQISARMIWETYPVIKIFLLWVLCFVLLFLISRKIFTVNKTLPPRVSKVNVVSSFIIFFFIAGVCIYGRIGQFPLRWSDAYKFRSDYKANLSLNPFQSFASSLKYRHSGFDIKKAKHYYKVMAPVFSVSKPDSGTMSLSRVTFSSQKINIPNPNVVLVICESFSAYKSSMWGNPLNTTPYFNELCKKGVFFNNCYTPAYGTARGVWAIITGIPDVTSFKTASRNPNIVNQYSILDQLEDYEKLYFIGGSASWANIRGVLKGNIKNLHLFEEEDYKAKRINVWGISDKDLFLEANAVFKDQTSPFFGIIQTADNHRPYTIPKADKLIIKERIFPKDTLTKYGFWSNEELNAYTYMDYTFQTFLEAAAKEAYFDNTIFVFVGDHGIRGNAGDMLPKVWTEQSLTLYHVPLLFYAPGLLQPQTVEKKVSQLDVLPSITSLMNKPVLNKTMGRDIFFNPAASDSDLNNNHAFVYDFDMRLLGLVSGTYFFKYNLQTKEENVYSLRNNDPLPKGIPSDALVSKFRDLTLGYYETARYLLYHNKKDIR